MLAVRINQSHVLLQKVVQRWSSVRGPKCVGLEELQREFLGQHDIADWEVTSRHEAQPARLSAVFVELLNVHLVALPNAVALAGVAADHLEIPTHLVLLALRRRQIAG
jgi:hypothetical protein